MNGGDPIRRRLLRAFGLAALAASGNATMANGAPRASERLPLTISGFRPDRIDGRHMRLGPGSCATADGRRMIGSTTALDIDVDTIGAGGRDREEPLADGDSIQIYLIENEGTGQVQAMLSPGIVYHPYPAERQGIAIPPGWRVVRKLMFGFVYNEANWGGIPNYHLAHWPMPYFSFTDFEDSRIWQPLYRGMDGTFKPVDLAPFLPQDARLAKVMCTVTAVDAAGSAYLQSSGGQRIGIRVGTARPGEVVDNVVDVRVTSQRQLYYRVTGGARLTIGVMGYAMSAVS